MSKDICDFSDNIRMIIVHQEIIYMSFYFVPTEAYKIKFKYLYRTRICAKIK